MSKSILVVNAGSSSLKFKLYDWEMNEQVSGLCERIGIDGFFKLNYKVNNEEKKYEVNADFANHDLAIDFLFSKLLELELIKDLSDVVGVGHRVVQGANLSESSIVDEKVLKIIEDCIMLAPLHNKPEADVLKIVMNKMPHTKNVAVFDTSFHTSIPKVNYYYPVPKDWIENLGVKKYGFHGTSYRFINEKMGEILMTNRPLNLIVCHLGNGASICCIKDGKSYDTTMGLTPLCGLVMGTRSGDVDASVFDLVGRQTGLTVDAIFNKLNKESGLKSICGSSDFRDIQNNVQPGNDFEFAIDIFIQKIVNYIAIYKNMLEEKVDGIVFTGGIGENAASVRKMVCEKIKGLDLNDAVNESKIGDYAKISQPLSRYKVFVVRTNEELKIAQDTKELVEKIN
ncbi:MAG: acetate kinase [Malacoplasma sp.]|nr:acetate kinase [Malacoplasma sp.]